MNVYLVIWKPPHTKQVLAVCATWDLANRKRNEAKTRRMALDPFDCAQNYVIEEQHVAGTTR